MSEWKEIELGEVAHVQTGPFGSQLKNEQYITGGTPVVTVEHIKDFRIIDFDYPSITNEDKERLSKYLMKEGDILFTRVGSVDLSAYVSKGQNGWMFSSRMLRVRPSKEINSRFLSYFVQQKSFRDYIINIAVGATMPSINTGILKTIPISYPPLKEQNEIASVLSSLDDKIDLLHRQNQTLEQMAETLFRQWFVEEVDDEWEFTSLENFVTCFNGVSYKSADLNPSDTAMITLKSFARDGGFRLDGFKEYTGKYKEQHIVNEGDLVVAHTDITQDAALIGNPIMVIGRREYKTLLISMDLVKVVSNHDWLSKEFLYYQMKSRDFKQHCLGYSNGSTVLHLSKQAVPSYEFFLPPKELVAEFTSQVKPLIEKSNKNIKHIRNLEEIRDTLLPKLMSGEVRIMN
ncbi:MAG: restriction endonuclease subunit S [Balneolales bacterium]|nr:restriction endonuclease subunit S [Balneolales bacterium]